MCSATWTSARASSGAPEPPPADLHTHAREKSAHAAAHTQTHTRRGTAHAPSVTPATPDAAARRRYSNWPTIPQCYIGGEFVGGCDLLIEMYQNGELAEMVEKANAE